MPLRICLLEIGRSKRSRPGYNEFHFDLALGYLAAAAGSAGHDCQVIQQIDESEDDIFQQLADFRPHAVGFTCNSYNYHNAVAFKQHMPAILPDVITMVGGVHASADRENAAHDFDVVVIGEGEETLVELLGRVKSKVSLDADLMGVNGIAYMRNGSYTQTGRRPRLDDLDKFGYPVRLEHFYRLSKGVPPNPPGKRVFAPIIFSRGCVHDCAFCTNESMYGRTLRFRNPVRIVDEMETLLKTHGVSDFWTHDENVLSSRDHLRAICTEIVHRRLNVTWGGMASLELVDKDFLATLRKGGCVILSYGVESPRLSTLDYFGKRWAHTRVSHKISLTFDAGIIPVALFMIGGPDETEESLNATVNFALSLKAIRYRFAYLYPFLGTRLREDVEARDLWLDPVFRSNAYATCEVPVLKCGVKPEIMQRAENHALHTIYTSRVYADRIREFANRNPEWREALYGDWKNAVEREINHKVGW